MATAMQCTFIFSFGVSTQYDASLLSRIFVFVNVFKAACKASHAVPIAQWQA